ncbi:anaerobic benzoate catabolism transcriptional regulator [Sphingomonas paucimobilis]|nr:anaerobic benzoate catabolism transcriptional regulator [Sphingomonas paucimobilis]
MSGKFDGAALGTRIKLLREMRDMSLQAVADAAGLTKSHVWELEQGRSINPTVNAVRGLSEALSVSPAMLLGLDDKMPPLDPFAMKIAGMISREISKRQEPPMTDIHDARVELTHPLLSYRLQYRRDRIDHASGGI